MRVKLWFQLSSQPLVFNDVYATYQKGALFCVGYWEDGQAHVKKYPIQSLFMVDETDFPSSQPKEDEDAQD